MSDYAALSDTSVESAVRTGRFGVERVFSRVLGGDPEHPNSPAHVFMLFGQRYTPDAEVMANVVFPRVRSKRMLPSSLDVAFAALGNDRAAELLMPEVRRFEYQGNLHLARQVVDAQPRGFWTGSFYTTWLHALRTLSPRDFYPGGDGLPSITRTRAFQLRMLNTQLASWAELRHDTILDAKQSYSGGAVCTFPDAYVEPVPAFFGALRMLAQQTTQLANGFPPEVPAAIKGRMAGWATRFGDTMGRLQSMAEHERRGEPFAPDDLAFINTAVTVQSSCGWSTSDGWFPQLYFDAQTALKDDRLVADVHTAPTDEYGDPVGHVLHVGTGYPRLMVITLRTCSGPRAYAGVVSAFRETVTQNFERLTDDAWSSRERTVPPPAWLSSLRP